MASLALHLQRDAPPFTVVRNALAEARAALGMDVAYFTEMFDGWLVVRAVDGDAAAFGLFEGQVHDLADTFCAWMVIGELACWVPDVRGDPVAAPIGATGGEPALGSYAGVPVRHADGSLYGTFCCASREPRPGLDERDARLLTALAGVVAGQLEHEHQYHQVLETAREPVWITDLDGRTVFTNQPLADLLGVPRESLAGRSAFDFLSGNHAERARTALVTRASGLRERYEIELRREDGALVPVEVSGAPLTDAAGKVIGTVAMITDLSERKAAERLSDARFRWLAELVGHQIWIAGADGRLEFVNARLREYYGADVSLERTSDWRAHLHPDDLDAPERVAADRAAGRPYEFTARVRRHDGEYREHLARAFPDHDDAGRLVRWYGITTDLTQQRVQERLIESEARLREAQRIARLAAFEWAPSGELWASDEFLELLELSREEFRGWASVLERAHPDDRYVLAARRALGVVSDSFEHRIVLPGGEQRTLQVRRRGLTGTVQDVTEHRAAETADRARVEAERANRAKSDFLSRMSHELRTPLNAILGFGQLLELDELSSDQSDSVGHILKAGAHLLELINEVLEISRIEAGALRLSLEPVELASAVREVADLVSPLAADREVSLTVDPGDAGLCVRADLQRFKQILLNLLSNAIKYNRHGGVVTVRVRALPDGRTRIAVSDTGAGLRPDGLARMFSPFERLGAAGSGMEGTGLGLALSRSLAEAMGGELTASSRHGVGCDLDLVLETADAPEDGKAGRVMAAEPAPEAFGDRTRVLCVEDNPSNLRLVERVLTRAGVEVMGAPQGRLGIELAVRHAPDLVLLDLDLPDISGEHVLDILREDPSTAGVPVVICSADASRATIERLLAAGARDYLTKPLDVGRLLKTVAAVTDGRER